MRQFQDIERRRRNLRIVLFIIILTTLPFYCLGAYLWGTAPQRRSGEATIPGTATFTPLGQTATNTLVPSITPLFGTPTVLGPLQPTPFQFIPPTRIPPTATLLPTVFIVPTPTTAPSLTPFPTTTPLPTPTTAPSLTPFPSSTPSETPTDTPTSTPTETETVLPFDTLEAPGGGP